MSQNAFDSVKLKHAETVFEENDDNSKLKNAESTVFIQEKIDDQIFLAKGIIKEPSWGSQSSEGFRDTCYNTYVNVCTYVLCIYISVSWLS